VRVLIATWDGAGGFQPQQTLIRGLAAKGHDVHVAAHQSLQRRIEAAGARFQHLPTITDYDSRKPITRDEERAIVLDGLIFSEAFGDDVYATASRVRPDVQLVDMALLTSFIAARATKTPTGLLTTTVFKFVEWFGGQYLQRYTALKRFAARVGYDLPV
jgi:UDP:flavonoid glycosyltransferase YjiC (YdhE family)